MKLILNATNLKLGGALQVTCSVLEQLKKFPGNEYHVFLSPQLAGYVSLEQFPSNFFFYNFNSNPTSSIINLFTFSKKLDKLEMQIKPDFVLSMFGPAVWKPKAPHLVGFANGMFLYSRSRFVRETWLEHPIKRAYYMLRRYILLGELKREATLLWTETEYAKKHIHTATKIPREKIHIITNTYDIRFENAAALVDGRDKLPTEPYKFLYLTADYPHKNLNIFNELLPLIKEQNIKCQFFVTLPEDIFRKRFPEHQNSQLLKNLGPLAPEQCPEAYANVDALFFPSLVETFSSNYPEAMIMKRPIITSDLDFAHFICGDAALYFDPYSALSIIDSIKLLINNQPLQERMVKAGLKRLVNFDSAYSRTEKLLNIMQQHLEK
ncbi:MAG: glycosyltransferase [Flavipsychrobacter sp.]|nr:glycosyltransferase [Flavipsychrobacter sp.]